MTSSHALASDRSIGAWFVVVTISCIILAFFNLACKITDVVTDPINWATWGTFLRFFRVMWALVLSIEFARAVIFRSIGLFIVLVTISSVILAFWN